MKPAVRKLTAAALFALTAAQAAAQSSWESEKLALEMAMQRRVESALSKILPDSAYVVVVQIEPWAQPLAGGRTEPAPPSEYFLPGVPARRRIDGATEAMRDLVESLQPDQQNFLRFIRRISATIVLDQSLPDEQVERIRELARQILGLEPSRGDTLTVQRSFLRENLESERPESSISKLQRSLQDYWLIISLALIVFCITVFLLFVFGPLRGFLSRFVEVLPTLKPVQPDAARVSRMGTFDSQMLPAMMAQAFGYLPPPGGAGGGMNPSNFSGSLMVENPNKRTTPFGFIREDHLSNLATLLSRENPEKAAVVLGYLPPEWISRVLSKVDPQQQSDITEHLATTRQLLPEQVEDIEQDLKRRLDYLIGGPDRILAVYESLDSEGQRKMLDNLRLARPDLAEELRKHTFLFEDLERLDPTSLKSLLREIDLQVLMLALRGVTESFRDKVFENLSAGKAEILREELEFNDGPAGAPAFDAQRKIVAVARRLEKEGHLQFPEGDGDVPAVRYGGSLRETLKLPEGFGAPTSDPMPPSDEKLSDSIEDRIRAFMSRQNDPSATYPPEEAESGAPPDTPDAEERH